MDYEKLRLDAGLTQAQVAKKVNITERTYRRIIKGDIKKPRQEIVDSLSRVLSRKPTAKNSYIGKRLSKGLTQVEVATIAGISIYAYQRIENGSTKQPKPETVLKLKEILG